MPSEPAAVRGHIKGAPVREFLRWVEAERGVAALAALAEPVARQHPGVLYPGRPQLGVLPSGWYAAAPMLTLLEALVRERPAAEVDDMLASVVGAVMEANLGGVYRRLFLRVFISPRVYLRAAQRLWNLHFDTGQLTVREASRNRFDWEMREWRSHHRLLCRMVTASEPSVFGAMGCREVQSVETACVDLGDSHCGHSISWS